MTDEDGNLIRYKMKPHFKGQSPDKRNGEIYGEFLSSRFSKALGFFADDEWVADVNCPDCEKSLNRGFQGASFHRLNRPRESNCRLARGIDVNCNNKDAGSACRIASETASAAGAPRAEIDAFKLWLAFIDHGDTKTDNHKFACLKSKKNGNTSHLQTGRSGFLRQRHGIDFRLFESSEKKARLETWRKKDPIEVSGGRCTTNAKSVGDTTSAKQVESCWPTIFSDCSTLNSRNQTITRVFAGFAKCGTRSSAGRVGRGIRS